MQEIRWIQRFENYKTALDNLDETVDCINKGVLQRFIQWLSYKRLK